MTRRTTILPAPRHLTGALLCAALLVGALGCEEPKITPEQAAPYAESWASTVGPELKAQAVDAATSKALKGRLEESAASEATGGEPAYDTLVDTVYGQREYKPGFVKAGELTERGVAVVEVLSQVQADGFDPAWFKMESVKEDLAKLSELREEFSGLGEFEAGDAERAFITGWLTQQPESAFDLSPANHGKLTEMVMADASGKALRDQLDRYAEVSNKMATLEARVEHTLARGLTRYAFKMRHHRIDERFVHPRQDDRYNDPETRGRRPAGAKGNFRAGQTWRTAVFTAQAVAKAKKVEILSARMRAVLSDALTVEDVPARLARLSPSPQYDALKKEHARYSEIAAAGGWGTVEAKRSLKKGRKDPTVRKLKERLQKEGYLPAATHDDVFDDALVEAIKSYERTHQLNVDGKPDRVFWRSLNVSAKRRAAQIMLNMKRWRDSDVSHHDDPVYVTVNIPDFHAEIWKDQTRQMRMRVVVGNNDTSEDEETGDTLHPNRTPTLSAYIDRIIYNPFWNVTPRIRAEEILVDVRKDLEGRYKAKMKAALATKAAAKKPANPLGIGTPTLANALIPPKDTTATPAVAPVAAPEPVFWSASPDGVVFDLAGFAAALEAKTGAPVDAASMFPYVSAETGIIDVSTTNPENIPPWYAANGYEVMHAGKSWEFVRQLNGEENALGQVKIIFPNLHDVYLHDTNKKFLFSREIRAFSHGCMRMHQPLDFAQWILENDGQFDERAISKALDAKEYSAYFLKKLVPVHIVYFTVRADDQGRANFLADIYDRDDA
jgi:murein L,D-transpeptidase YcbB/YkuD